MARKQIKFQWSHTKNYLSARLYKVGCNRTKTDFVDFQVGVPQGSVLELLLFSFYTGNFGRTAMKHKLRFHHYSDDTQTDGQSNNGKHSNLECLSVC